MKARMSFRVSEAFDKKRHYVSPGGYEVRLRNGDVFAFDFTELEYGPEPEDPTVITATVRNEDTDAFPEVIKLKPRLHEIEAFTEFYIYTGEDETDDLLKPIELLSLEIIDSGNKFRIPPESSEFISVEDNLGEKARNEYKSYDFTYTAKQPLLDQVTALWANQNK